MRIDPLRILQVSTADIAGGAEKVAWNLFHSYRSLGNASYLAVGTKRSADADVFVVRNEAREGRWSRSWSALDKRLAAVNGSLPGSHFFAGIARYMARPGRAIYARYGVEDFHFPGTRRILDLPPTRPDLVHLHNVHGGYFDLRVLPRLSRRVPVLVTLHDAWLLSGHCAHSFDCERWRTGCGSCPDLGIYPALARDATRYNWRRKQRILARSRLYVAAPSQWLMRKVEHSILAPAIIESRVIPNGVDLTTFHPGDRLEARATLNIPPDAHVVLFTGYGIRHNMWKDYRMMRAAIAAAAAHLRDKNTLFIALGEEAPSERIDAAEIRFVRYQENAESVARYYQAADVYIHAAKVDTFPNSVLEALACGIPAIATAVGGVPEQIKPLRGLGTGAPSVLRHGADEATGVLVPAGDAAEMAHALATLLYDRTLRDRLGESAARDCAARFDLARQTHDYLAWYEQMLKTAPRRRQRFTLSRGANVTSAQLYGWADIASDAAPSWQAWLQSLC
jgi:glycosyltransferase involved in cell wall biosynthesis